MIKRYSADGWLKYIDYRSDIKALSSNRYPAAPSIQLAAAGDNLQLVKPVSGLSPEPQQQSSWAGRLIERIEREFRIGQSYRLKGSSGDLSDPFDSTVHHISGEKRSCGIMCTGQRDLLWHAGVQTIREHWLFGIGFGGWKTVLELKLGYPFDSPHVGPLDSWGQFGIAGAILYFWLAFTLIARLLRSARCDGHNRAVSDSIWLSFSAFALLMTEMSNASNYFAVSALALWGWVLVGLQDRVLQPQRH
jgi:hypothetical protein